MHGQIQGLPSATHSLLDFQSQLAHLKSSLMHHPSSEKYFMNSLQWNIEGAQSKLEKIIEETEGKRLPVVKSMRPMGLAANPAAQHLVGGAAHGYREWKQYGDPKRRAKTIREEPEKVIQVAEPSPLAAVNPLSFTIKKVR
jgi:hypothetical protein